MSNVFISYVREDFEIVDRICKALISHGISVWLDRQNLSPGQIWKWQIRNAIRNGSYFIACFSSSYNKKDRTYMNEEVLLAIEELRLRVATRAWFIPLRLDDCTVPDIDIGAGQSLADIHFLDFYKEEAGSLKTLINVINPLDAYYSALFDNANLDLQRQISSFPRRRSVHPLNTPFTVGLVGYTGAGKSLIAQQLGAEVTALEISHHRFEPVTLGAPVNTCGQTIPNL